MPGWQRAGPVPGALTLPTDRRHRRRHVSLSCHQEGLRRLRTQGALLPECGRPQVLRRSPARRWRASAPSTPSRAISGSEPGDRRAARQEKSRSILDALEPWLREKLALISQKTKLAEAIRYALSRWDGLTRFVDDGRIKSTPTSSSTPSAP